MSVPRKPILLLFGIFISMSAACQLYQQTPDPSTTISEKVEKPQATPTSTISSLSVQGFESFLEQAEGTDRNERQGLVNLYTARLESGPLIEDNWVIFLYRGEGYRIQLIGDMNNWNADVAPVLSRVDGTDLWYHQQQFEEDARLDYQFLVDDKSSILDQFNPKSTAGALGPSSTFMMTDYQMPPELLPPTKEIPQGSLTSHTIDSQYLDQIRTFFVYEPPGQTIGEPLPTVYINDGSDFINIINAPSILDKLIADRLIPPIVAVFVPPIDRKTEYHANESYVRFLADELAPFLQTNYETDPDPENTAVLGSSLGGNAALFTAQSRPDIFGLVGSFSAVIEEDDEPVIDQFFNDDLGLQIEGQLPPDIRPYLVVGSYETDVEVDGERMNILAGNRKLAQVYRSRGYNLVYEERPEGHSWGMWQAALGRALDTLIDR